MTINPRLLALAAKLDAANECARRLEARQNEDDTFIERDAKEQLCAAAYAEMAKLEWRLAKTAAANVEEIKLKAKYARVESYYNESDQPGAGDLAITVAVITELRVLGGEGNSYVPSA